MPWHLLALLSALALGEELHFQSEQQLLQGLEDASVERQAQHGAAVQLLVSKSPKSKMERINGEERI